MDVKDEMFRRIYQDYTPMVRMAAKRRNIPSDEIDDLVQDTFAAYYSHYPLDWPEYQIKATIMRIIKNLCVDYYRKQGSRPVTYCDILTLSELAFLDGRNFYRDSLTVLLEQLEYEEVQKALRGMKEEWAQVVVLYGIEGRPISEISELLNVSENACRARLCRGRKYLRKRLSPEAPEKYRPSKRAKTSPLTEKRIPEGI